MRIFRAVALAMAIVVPLSACASRQGIAPLERTADFEARVQNASIHANLDGRGMYYEGNLPPNIAPLTEKTDDLGRQTFLSTRYAIEQFGERDLRYHIPQVVRACGRIELQRLWLAELRRQADHIEAFQLKAKSQRDTSNIVTIGSVVAGGIQAWSAFGADYGATYLLGSVIPSLSNQMMYNTMLDGYDMQNSMWLAMSRFWFAQNDIWLDAMGEWCPSFVGYVEANGRLVQVEQRYQDPIRD
ncbi:MAG: hypothetical protein KBC38_00390 [Candidatus Pacebacteria bacterium]|nr:hypothetical protein [Candidatus Paceibacterota bacterium]MBP9840455.1 hypothetical protein [Candidatus Paceibacterota bacterium]